MGVEVPLEKVTGDPEFADRLKAKSVLRSIEVEPTPELLDAIAESGDGESLAARISRP